MVRRVCAASVQIVLQDRSKWVAGDCWRTLKSAQKEWLARSWIHARDDQDVGSRRLGSGASRFWLTCVYVFMRCDLILILFCSCKIRHIQLLELASPPHWRFGLIVNFAVRSKKRRNMRCGYLFFPSYLFPSPFCSPPSQSCFPSGVTKQALFSP